MDLEVKWPLGKTIEEYSFIKGEDYQLRKFEMIIEGVDLEIEKVLARIKENEDNARRDRTNREAATGRA